MTRSLTASQTNMGGSLFKKMSKKKEVERKQIGPSAVVVSERGRYQIKSGHLAGEFVARAFPKPPTNVRGVIAEAKGASEEAAIAALHEVLDARETRRISERRSDSQTGSTVPSTEEYIEAIEQITLSDAQRAMLIALSLAEEEGMSESRMADAAGYKSSATAIRSFAGAGLLIANYLSKELAMEVDGTSLLGLRSEPQNEKQGGSWILHPELRQAVRSAL